MTGATTPTPSLGRRVLALMGPMMVASVMGQAIAQTDLWVISTLGEQAVAAAALPQRLLLLDSITAMAMGPVVGLSVAGALSAHARRRAVQSGLVGATAAGLLIAAIGLAVLPYLVDTLVAAPGIRDDTRSALFWLLIAAPVRLAQFVGAMALFALRRSRPLLTLYAVAVVANAALDWFFVHGAGLGFAGAYAATSVIAALECAVTVGLLRDHLSLSLRLRDSARWLRQVARTMLTEWGHMLSVIGFDLLLVLALTLRASWDDRLAAFSAGAVLTATLNIPITAMVNATGMVCTGAAPSARDWRNLRGGVLAVSATVGVLVATAAWTVLPGFYGLHGAAATWFTWLMVAQATALPLRLLAATAEGRHKAADRFGVVLRLRLLQELGIALPVFLAGLLTDNAVLAWSGIVLGCAVNYRLLQAPAPRRPPGLPFGVRHADRADGKALSHP
ncbi:MATE family efflux transporter [Kitasatospora sp. MAP5-34]|uniref:MATE family efflux transporter n=1 Tax=Kitasatospora sp. MAP5-34 TaxID=3035102 RepID=UPI0024770EE0|nr:MATE family efflux transporter [Kitasatospora sp. MAP5-34]MDH6577448.1 Na+-driven multidrug efflux pump [Kitasatospora sp. MAP5-34]